MRNKKKKKRTLAGWESPKGGWVLVFYTYKCDFILKIPLSCVISWRVFQPPAFKVYGDARQTCVEAGSGHRHQMERDIRYQAIEREWGKLHTGKTPERIAGNEEKYLVFRGL